MMSLTFGLFTQGSGSGPLGPLVFFLVFFVFKGSNCAITNKANSSVLNNLDVAII